MIGEEKGSVAISWRSCHKMTGLFVDMITMNLYNEKCYDKIDSHVWCPKLHTASEMWLAKIINGMSRKF